MNIIFFMNAHQFILDLKAHVGRPKITLREVSALTGVSPAHLSKILNGKVMPTLPIVIRLWPFAYGKSFPQLPSMTSGVHDGE